MNKQLLLRSRLSPWFPDELPEGVLTPSSLKVNQLQIPFIDWLKEESITTDRRVILGQGQIIEQN